MLRCCKTLKKITVTISNITLIILIFQLIFWKQFTNFLNIFVNFFFLTVFDNKKSRLACDKFVIWHSWIVHLEGKENGLFCTWGTWVREQWRERIGLHLNWWARSLYCPVYDQYSCSKAPVSNLLLALVPFHCFLNSSSSFVWKLFRATKTEGSNSELDNERAFYFSFELKEGLCLNVGNVWLHNCFIMSSLNTYFFALLLCLWGWARAIVQRGEGGGRCVCVALERVLPFCWMPLINNQTDPADENSTDEGRGLARARGSGRKWLFVKHYREKWNRSRGINVRQKGRQRRQKRQKRKRNSVEMRGAEKERRGRKAFLIVNGWCLEQFLAQQYAIMLEMVAHVLRVFFSISVHIVRLVRLWRIEFGSTKCKEGCLILHCTEVH